MKGPILGNRSLGVGPPGWAGWLFIIALALALFPRCRIFPDALGVAGPRRYAWLMARQSRPPRRKSRGRLVRVHDRTGRVAAIRRGSPLVSWRKSACDIRLFRAVLLVRPRAGSPTGSPKTTTLSSTRAANSTSLHTGRERHKIRFRILQVISGLAIVLVAASVDASENWVRLLALPQLESATEIGRKPSEVRPGVYSRPANGLSAIWTGGSMNSNLRSGHNTS